MLQNKTLPPRIPSINERVLRAYLDKSLYSRSFKVNLFQIYLFLVILIIKQQRFFMTYLSTWNSFITLPFKVGHENITTACMQKQLFVIKRTFKDHAYKYEPPLHITPLSLQCRVALFAKGVILCLPIIGHIVSLALHHFSSSIFPEMPLDLEMKCSYRQKLEIVKLIYTNKPENLSNSSCIALANTLISHEDNIKLFTDYISQINLLEDPSLTRELMQKNPEAIEQIKNPLANQILNNDSTDNKFIVDLLDPLELNPVMSQEVIKELVLQTKNLSISQSMQRAIAHVVLEYDVIKQLFSDNTLNIALAKILLIQEKNIQLVIDNISCINLLEDLSFTQILFQGVSTPKQITQHLAKQILEKQTANKNFIVNLFESINLNPTKQEEVIQAILHQMNSTDDSHQIQIAIALAIVKKYRRGPVILMANIDKFTHTEELYNLLSKTTQGQGYIKNNINKFEISEEKKNGLQYATSA